MDTPTKAPAAEAVLLSSLTRLMAQWSSLTRQEAIAREAGLTIDAGDIQPVYILGLGGPQRASDLATNLRVTRPTMSKQLSRLDAAGLIAKSPDPADGRATIVSLTEAGARVFALLVAQGLEMIDGALHDWDAAERRTFAELTLRFVRAVGIDVPPDFPPVRHHAAT
ncbi:MULTISPECIES: winged helix DNA-binding protein [unclassified Microbacterium]|uniref:MarR family winged helix-turn-helix transcriptional regulator n=1 Tax=unclassified Microbacterium TaxID=2609290 RepID=UPI00214ADCF3|nr:MULTISPECIES: winged helix DNA-binding protein [unclassified Microbacterium]MCR2784757.1 winged helix DNA-binding protein [Microbacterium sp. zg.B96]MDL5352788.1 winged helix DNA-binding protein [Microbacterium sp. zg-YB36]WIM16296.1 winged helix DNA-binding protein [Microbacterium sp. zg-B96]